VPRFVVIVRRSWKRIILIGSLCGCAAIAGALYAFLRTPSWYAPPVIAPADQQKVRNNLVAAEQAFTESLRAGRGPFIYRIFQDDLNRWITMRREIYPLIEELAPPQLADPFVMFDEGVITVAGRYSGWLGGVVASIDIVPTLEEDALVLRATAVRCGSVGVPMHLGGIGLDGTIERDREETWPGSPRIWGDFSRGLRIETEAWWKNGGIDYRMLDVWVEPGRLCLKIEPLGPHWARGRNDQG
jgi:hypothetical protein